MWVGGCWGGVNFLDKDVGSKIVESSERSDRRENVLSELVAVIPKVAVELENNQSAAIQAKNEIASPNQKLDG